jgi:hypothetical protein
MCRLIRLMSQISTLDHSICPTLANIRGWYRVGACCSTAHTCDDKLVQRSGSLHAVCTRRHKPRVLGSRHRVHMYVGVAQRMSWPDARQYCQDNNTATTWPAFTPPIRTQKHWPCALPRRTTGTIIGDNGVWNGWAGGIGHYCWIGLTDVDTEGLRLD